MLVSQALPRHVDPVSLLRIERPHRTPVRANTLRAVLPAFARAESFFADRGCIVKACIAWGVVQLRWTSAAAAGYAHLTQNHPVTW